MPIEEPSFQAVDWQSHEHQLRQIRREVFIQEQSVPEELEWEDRDVSAYHWLALDSSGHAIGCIRMLPDGHIGRLAVLKAWRNKGVGGKLLAQAMDKARKEDWRAVWLNSQTHAIGFYERYGFIAHGPEFNDAGIPHRRMSLTLREVFILGKDSGKHKPDNASLIASSLISQSLRQVRIFSECLNPAIFNTESVRSAMSELARRHKSTEIRMLILQPDKLAGSGHLLLALQQRLNSSIHLRALPEDQAEALDEEFLIADGAGLLVIPRKHPGEGWCDFNNLPTAQNYILQFDILWNQAKEDPSLRRLTLG